jgi:hypothetical protein
MLSEANAALGNLGFAPLCEQRSHTDPARFPHHFEQVAFSRTQWLGQVTVRSSYISLQTPSLPQLCLRLLVQNLHRIK